MDPGMRVRLPSVNFLKGYPMKHLLLMLVCLSSVAFGDDDMPKNPKIILPIRPIIVEPDKPKPIQDPTDPTVISEIKLDE